MIKTAMLCLVLVMLLTSGLIPRVIYADDSADYQSSDWKRWLGEEDWSYISPEIQNNIRQQMKLLESIEKSRIKVRNDLQNVETKDPYWFDMTQYSHIISDDAHSILDHAELPDWRLSQPFMVILADCSVLLLGDRTFRLLLLQVGQVTFNLILCCNASASLLVSLAICQSTVEQQRLHWDRRSRFIYRVFS